MTVSRLLSAPLAALLVAAGCSAWRPLAPLSMDEQGEVASLAARSSKCSFRVIAGDETREESAEVVRAALRRAGFRVTDAESAITVQVAGPAFPAPSIADGEAQTVWWILTLGLVPMHDSRAEVWTLRIQDGSPADPTRTCELSRPGLFGWLAIPACALPGWTLQWGHAPSSPTQAESSARPARLALLFARAVADASPPQSMDEK